MKSIVNLLLVSAVVVVLCGGCNKDEVEQPDLHLANTVWIFQSPYPHFTNQPDIPEGIYALCFSDNRETVFLYELDENLKKKKNTVALGYGYQYYGNKVIIGNYVCEKGEYWLKYKNMTFFKSSKTELDIRTQ